MTNLKFGVIKDNLAAGLGAVLFLIAAIALICTLVFILTDGHDAHTIWSLVGVSVVAGLVGGLALHGWPSIVIRERRR